MSTIPNSPLKLDLPQRVSLAQALISTAIDADPKVAQAKREYYTANQDYVSHSNRSAGAYMGAFVAAAVDALLVGTGAISAAIAAPAVIIPMALIGLGIKLGSGTTQAKAIADKAQAVWQATVEGVRASFSVETEAKRFE